MTQETSRTIAGLLQELAAQYPEMRFGQLVNLVATLAGDSASRDIYDLEDEEFIRAAREHLQRRSQAAAN